MIGGMGNQTAMLQLKNPMKLDSYILINILYVHVPVHIWAFMKVGPTSRM